YLHAHRSVRMTSIFFFSAAEHRDLHSFPTRRSSDLASESCRAGAGGRSVHRTRTANEVPSGVATRCSEGASRGVCKSSFQFDSRSEEHTSELQSLRHLVCRLLLEKKKNNRN